jgi:hypothetical protein
LPQVTQPRTTEASNAARQRPLSIAKLTALGFVTGGVIHAAAFLLLWRGIQLYGPAYPGWRHVVMATVDGAIAWVALKWPRGLFVALPAWIAEQWLVNGFGPITAVVAVAVAGLVWERWRSAGVST